MLSYLSELTNIGIFIIFSFILAAILLGAVYVLSFTTKIDLEKSSAYECGFQPFSESQYPFEVQFALIAILFLLFDIEVLYLFPIGTSTISLFSEQMIFLSLFFIIIAAGLLYEISRQVLRLFTK
jgi:NADH-quinone oxidoreductase subunit A